MVDTVTPEKRSKIMAKVKSHGNKSTELKLIKIFKEYGIKGWRRKYRVFGNPDFVFPRSRLAIFVDGCFWHGCKEHCRLPESNRDYWVSKIDKNVKRDILINNQLIKKHWTVIRIWEHELRKGYSKEKIEEIKEIVEQDTPPDRFFSTL
jgi:DNA mismatch endonuclease (patch repair protein)